MKKIFIALMLCLVSIMGFGQDMPIKRQSKTVVPDRQNAEVVKIAPIRNAPDPSIVNLDANICYVEDVEDSTVSTVTFPAGCFKLSLCKMNDKQEIISRFIAYIANDDAATTKLNGYYSIGIGGMFSSYMVVEGSSNVIELTGGYLQVSYIKTMQTGCQYDFYGYVWDEYGNVYVFGMQLPTMLFKGANIVTITDNAPIYEEATKSFNVTYTAYDYVEKDDQYLAEHGVINLYADNCSTQIGLQFIVGTSATDIPKRTYTINYTDAVGTVGGSNGMMFGSVTESYAMNYTEESFTNVWYIHSGTVTVNDNQVIVDGKNFLGKTVKATINLPATGIEEVEAAEVDGTAKTMENG